MEIQGYVDTSSDYADKPTEEGSLEVSGSRQSVQKQFNITRVLKESLDKIIRIFMTLLKMPITIVSHVIQLIASRFSLAAKEPPLLDDCNS